MFKKKNAENMFVEKPHWLYENNTTFKSSHLELKRI